MYIEERFKLGIKTSTTKEISTYLSKRVFCFIWIVTCV